VADSTVITPHQQQVWATSDEATVGNTFSAPAHVWRTGNAHAGPCTPLPPTTTDEGVTRPPACEKTLGAPRGVWAPGRDISDVAGQAQLRRPPQLRGERSTHPRVVGSSCDRLEETDGCDGGMHCKICMEAV
jgi:hypothetical protein